MSRDCSCHGAESRGTGTLIGLLERPRYSPGLILEDSDLTSAVDYTRELNRLLFKSLFGCGVICGLEVSVGGDCGLEVFVSPGLALDGCGDPLHLTGTGKIELGRKDGVLPPPGKKGPPERVKDFWVIACAKEKQCAPRELVCDGDDLDGTKQATRTRLGVEISISFDPPECVCGCLKLGDATPDQRARDLTAIYGREAKSAAKQTIQYKCGQDRFRCHEAHYTVTDCPADCGCGTACSCGCCVLLAWVHWEGEEDGRWLVLHKGVRRFIRPCLIDDPIKWESPEGGQGDHEDDEHDDDEHNDNGGGGGEGPFL